LADLSIDAALPVPETDDLGRYLEDTITIDWQTPAVADCARRLLAEAGARWIDRGPTAVGAAASTAGAPQDDRAAAAQRVETLFRFVRDAVLHSFDREDGAPGPGTLVPEAAAAFPPSFHARGIACRASETLALGHGLCFAKSHLLAALLRSAGVPTGFCYARLAADDRPGRFVLHGFNALWFAPAGRWVFADPRGDRGRAGEPGAIASDCRFAPPYSLAFAPDAARGEALLPFIYKRPARRIVDWLERVPDEAALRRSLPEGID